MSETDKRDVELQNLWGRRRDLDEVGWTRLYHIVERALKNYKPRELAGLREDNDVYIQEFFQDKVWRHDLLSRCDHIGALRLYYQRYLRDKIRSQHARAKWEVADEHDPDADSPPSLDKAPETKSDHQELFTELEEAGFSPAEVALAATAWLENSEEWVCLFIALSNCPDANVSERLIHLAQRKGIKSQAYKAEKLGFNWKGGNLAGFAETLLGRWITQTIGIELRAENSNLILAVLKILCYQALSWADQQEAAK
jgi:hypothetical protein